jgi:hypothetical protein
MCNVRNDIMFSVKDLPRGLSAPTEDHLSRLKHLLRYLHGAKHVAQTLRPTLKLHPHHHSLDISMYVDSDWAGCTHTRTHTHDVLFLALLCLYLVQTYFRTHARKRLLRLVLARRNFTPSGRGLPMPYF